MAFEGPSQREFAQLVTHHLVGDIDRHVLLAVVDRNGQADEIGQDHGAARPGFDRFFVFVGDGFFRFGQQMVVNERAFFE